ncbi:hypothetical protein M1N54_01525 [Thermodesulfovibrionales bacterium]|nr:hypothetical protein [Thermodesulfovibrionales bacterium]
MPLVEEVEHRVSRLEIIVEDIIGDRPVLISQRLDRLYEKIERDKTIRKKFHLLVILSKGRNL